MHAGDKRTTSGQNGACTKFFDVFDEHHLTMNGHPKDKKDMKRISTGTKY